MSSDNMAVLAAPPGEIFPRQREALGRMAERYLATGEIRLLLLDLSAVEYLDEEAIAWLLGLWREAGRRGACLAVSGASPIVAHKFARLGLHTLFAVYPDVAAARTALAASSVSAAASPSAAR